MCGGDTDPVATKVRRGTQARPITLSPTQDFKHEYQDQGCYSDPQRKEDGPPRLHVVILEFWVDLWGLGWLKKIGAVLGHTLDCCGDAVNMQAPRKAALSGATGLWKFNSMSNDVICQKSERSPGPNEMAFSRSLAAGPFRPLASDYHLDLIQSSIQKCHKIAHPTTPWP
ncbi:hypothetical protein K437DRAFT_258493 [Tilletiaria anomala UBC 951]|uniref:Uncharacterized protein n=1 Tax=Tilletiaria anomala (strain ATCC 24038 / CBS 436.72 / UBC 951) TaxID=1037660 RepID=A0A066VHE3_TILAU|nr:uncharacterized protein K437DRAFT_258493 [Tilletiaria anomala UBC 951]KDN40876.1 hypothetical protein K437DRAFT_258493 [Tilletiaria anomala UBC 951]